MFSGSYDPADVTFLLKVVDLADGVSQTDLTLEMELYTSDDGRARAELRDMHVM